jgi:hypothetical protein
MQKSTWFGLLIAACVGCGSSPGTTHDMMNGMMNDMMNGMPTVPDPGTGNGVDNNFGSVEPNDTPAHATPLGVSTAAGVAVWVSGNSTSATDGSDYFVFKSGQAGPFSFNICFGTGGITAMTATLWKVSNGQQMMPPIHQWTSSASCLQTAAGDASLEASTVYLFGVQATGAGMYSA